MTQAERERDALCEQIDKLVAERDLFAVALLEAEWTTHGGPVYSCKGCHHSWSYTRRHAPDCRVDAALTALGYPDEESRHKGRAKLNAVDQIKRYGSVVATGGD